MARLRCTYGLRLTILIVVIANVFVLFYLIYMQHKLTTLKTLHDTRATETSQLHVATSPDSVTFVFREYEQFENDIADSTLSLLSMFPDVDIVIVADTLPYPPLKLPRKPNVHLVTMTTSPDRKLLESRPENYIKTEYIILLPDGVRLKSKDHVYYMIDYLKRQQSDVTIAVWPVEGDVATCRGLTMNVKQWTLQYSAPGQPYMCDAIDGDFPLLMRRDDFLSLSSPFSRPLPTMLFIQSSLRHWKVAIGNRTLFQRATRLFVDSHTSWKHRTQEQTRLRDTYRTLGVKLVQRTHHADEWFGCGRATARCFGSVVDDMPDYIHQQRWTPPCCLTALRVTSRHVFLTLQSQGVRYWLEGGSLLGAARSGDIIPWDYDVDIGIYRDDIPLSPQLVECQRGGAVEDNDGFVWEKAREGDFFRVQYSETNHLHVDIFPFYSRDGIMTKDTWFKTHRQDTEFPERYVGPLSKISFVGMNVSVPNNWRDFLELKFGKGVIENPRYPDASEPSLP